MERSIPKTDELPTHSEGGAEVFFLLKQDGTRINIREAADDILRAMQSATQRNLDEIGMQMQNTLQQLMEVNQINAVLRYELDRRMRVGSIITDPAAALALARSLGRKDDSL